MICIAFLVFQILKKGFKKDLYTILTSMFLFCGLITLFVQTIVLQNEATAFYYDLTNMVKFFLWVLIPYYVYQRADQFKESQYEKIFLTISTLFTLGLLIPFIFGVGNQTYAGSDAGYKAFFFANNDTTLSFIASATFTGWYLFKKMRQMSFLPLLSICLLYLGNLLGLLLLGTKTGIIYGVIVTLILFIRFFFFQKDIGVTIKLITGILIALIVSIIYIKGRFFILSVLAGLILRLNYFYGLYNNDLLRFFTSSRSNFLEIAFSYYTDTGNDLLRLIGFGFNTRIADWKGGDLVEMDFLDVLFSLGVVGLLMTLTLLLYLSVKACKKRTIYSVLFFVLILYGTVAGHVLFSALSSTLFGLICGGLFIQKESLREKNENSH
ncbi:hypothetical protein X560_1697 [Listeria fleischmannii 1991]|uniref:Uncharacterized protein n=1 Tax=Listeria fleischmannii 1991 TaxID=1430899 RepID=A0A0J8J4C3_9LIST|nr:hypothetical protein X560_1697 [Listeria fleischmannii 1991]